MNEASAAERVGRPSEVAEVDPRPAAPGASTPAPAVAQRRPKESAGHMETESAGRVETIDSSTTVETIRSRPRRREPLRCPPYLLLLPRLWKVGRALEARRLPNLIQGGAESLRDVRVIRLEHH